MSNNRIIGREDEQRTLRKCYESKDPQLVIVYGRRRVGKTFLVEQFFEHQFAFQFVGAYKKPKETQLSNFAEAMRYASGENVNVPTGWKEAFTLLRDYLEQLPSTRRKVVYFDEMPWMDTPKSDFLSEFEWFWNSWGSKQDDLMFIVCGSATTWITKKLFNNKGGLFNRHARRIFVRPFCLNEVEQFLESRQISWSRYDIAECYMAMGGIPYYLNLLDSEYGYNENIDRIFFRKKGDLWDEFSHLYDTLFSNSENYLRVVEALSKKRMGLTRGEILQETGLPDNGSFSDILKDLAESDFIRPYNYFGKKKQDMLYQLSDYYTLFYYRFVKDYYGRDEHFWSHTLDNPSRRAWAGLAFEQLCKDHIEQIKRSISIAGVLSEQSSWFSKKEGSERGTQIDMLIDRRDRVINLCEMKFSVNEFVIDKDYDAILRNRMATFKQETKTSKALHITMITTYGVKRNAYSNIVQSQVLLDDLFVAI